MAKTTPPSLSRIVPRKRLFALLHENPGASVIWVTGPPGAGKTTLVASYLDGRKLPRLWYQLDDGDADPATFFYYMGLAAAEQMRPEQDRLPLLTPEYQAGLPAFTRRYFQTLFGGLNPTFTVVFDNYHELPAHAALHEVMRTAMQEIPPGGRVIVLSRGPPPPAMARLRANRQLHVIGWNELRLTREESDAIVCLRGRELSEPIMAELYEKTQGWAAGLVLMLEQLSAYGALGDASDLSTPQLIFDYLAGETFHVADPPTQDFLQKTALLPQMTGRMAEALSGNSEAEAILERLNHDNYFVLSRRTGSEPVFQYHPLLREFLLARFKESFPGMQQRELRQRAASVLEAAGHIEDAENLLREIGEWNDLADLIERHAVVLLDHGRGETLAHWLESLPPEVLQRRPWCLYWLGAGRLSGDPKAARLPFEQAFEQFQAQREPDIKGLLLSCSGAINALVYQMDDFTPLDRWITVLETLLKTTPEFPSDAVEARVTCSMFMAMVLRQPQHPDLPYWVERAHQLSQSRSDPSLRMSVEVLVAISIVWAGHYPKTLTVLESLRKLALSPGIAPFALIMFKTLESTYYMLTAQHEPCQQAVNDGLELGRQHGVQLWSHQLLCNGVAGALGAGNLETASQLLDRMAAHPEGARRLDLCWYHYFSTWHAMLCKDTLRAYQEQKLALRLALEVGAPFFVVLCRLASAQVLVECGEVRKAFEQLKWVHRLAPEIKNRLLEFTCLLSLAYMALEHGRRRFGLNALRYGLALGRQYDFEHFLWWRPAVMARLCVHALQEDIEVDYVRNLIRKRHLLPEPLPWRLAAWPWAYRASVLGPFRLRRDEASFPDRGQGQRRPLELLKVLIACGGEGVPENQITDALWPRINIDSAHHSFTTTLHRLRKLLGDDRAIVLRDGRLSLSRQHWWLDIWAFEQTVTEIDECLKHSPSQAVPDQLGTLADALLGLYRGPFLSQEADEPWLVRPRERWRGKFARAMTDIGRAWEQAGRLEQAVDIYLKSLDVDPLAEDVHRSLMLCQQRLGRPAAAVEAYQRCRQTFLAQGAEPSVETCALYDRIRAELGRPPSDSGV